MLRRSYSTEWKAIGPLVNASISLSGSKQMSQNITGSATHYWLRYLTPGLYIYALFYVLSYFNVADAKVSLDLSATVVAISSVLGFFIDSMSLYKLHPAYRLIRKSFFIDLYRNFDGTESEKSLSSCINKAELYREDILYSISKVRRDDLKIEHAIWIITFHINIITLFFGVLLVAIYASRGAPGANWLTVSCVVLLLFVLSLGTAIARLRSYNAKLLYLGHLKMQGVLPDEGEKEDS